MSSAMRPGCRGEVQRVPPSSIRQLELDFSPPSSFRWFLEFADDKVVEVPRFIPGQKEGGPHPTRHGTGPNGRAETQTHGARGDGVCCGWAEIRAVLLKMILTQVAHKSAPRRGAATADRWDPGGGVCEPRSGPRRRGKSAQTAVPGKNGWARTEKRDPLGFILFSFYLHLSFPSFSFLSPIIFEFYIFLTQTCFTYLNTNANTQEPQHEIHILVFICYLINIFSLF
jgi:hypothetical protein